MRLIDADKFEVCTCVNKSSDYVDGVQSMLEAIDSAPTVDAVPVVRCKYCAVPQNKYTGCPKLNGLVTPPDFYCPFGERKDGAD